MEGVEKQIESKEGLRTRIVRVAFDTYAVVEFLEIPAGLSIEKEKEDFDKELKARPRGERFDPSPSDVGRSFIECLITKGATKIQVDDFDGERSWKNL
ncbi:MAG: hypothetical protein A3I44_04705 [Candidatus Sungbacteria bacterium RIFCSPLOWO2_02_FULL_51_17]|nr:MAG: hypothetical protein A2676_05435 [Candidatus Sungbacteria bacterium RIFCSPHIGHO2_01_FULL_51_22]OHA12468.1 MAG: hypothetical protein A3I44_04705 [Candidatus Sungbacteria bacterium RIFCSPLOWO2_02_FULL_51_17]